MMAKKAVVLLSGGLDSATVLFIARSKGFKAECLVFDYGQRHSREIECAKRVARFAGCKYRVIRIALPWKGSALLDKRMPIRKRGKTDVVPATYVPSRNLIFLSFAASYAEAAGAEAIFIGANAVDFSGYPDCRPVFLKAFERTIKAGTKAGAGARGIKIVAPLVNKSKSEIIKTGFKLGVPYVLTSSCYKGGRLPCNACDSCRLRAKGFREAGLKDPLLQ